MTEIINPDVRLNGDIRCPNDREYVNSTCWKCGMSRSACERYYTAHLDLAVLELEYAEKRLTDAQEASRRIQEDWARAFFLDGTKMYDLSMRMKFWLQKARNEGLTESEAAGRAFGQVLSEMGYSSPGSEQGL